MTEKSVMEFLVASSGVAEDLEGLLRKQAGERQRVDAELQGTLDALAEHDPELSRDKAAAELRDHAGALRLIRKLVAQKEASEMSGLGAATAPPKAAPRPSGARTSASQDAAWNRYFSSTR